MTSIFSLNGFIIFSLLLICNCTYLSRMPKLKKYVLSEKHGTRGLLYKSAVIGVRLSWLVSICCCIAGVCKLLLWVF